MGKSRIRIKSKKNSLKSTKLPPPVKKKKSIFSMTLTAITVIGGLVGIIVGSLEIYKSVKPDRQVFTDANYRTDSLVGPTVATTGHLITNKTFIKKYTQKSRDFAQFKTITLKNKLHPQIEGIFIPDFDQVKIIKLLIGTNSFITDASQLKIGLGLSSFINTDQCNFQTLRFGVYKSRLYFSAVFNYIENNETVGIIEYNRWRLFLPNVLDYHPTKTKLEVLDKQHNIIMSVAYERPTPDTVVCKVSGYLMGSNCIVVFPNVQESEKKGMRFFEKSEPNWKEHALNYIMKDTSIFKTHP